MERVDYERLFPEFSTMRMPDALFTVRGMMAAVAILAVYLLCFRTNIMLGMWAMGISLPALIWSLEVARMAETRGHILTITGQFVVFVRALMLTVAVYGGVASTTILMLTLFRR